MIQIRCDKCDRTIEIESAVAGQKITCPHCGDVNVVRAVGNADPRTAPDRAAAAGYPPAAGPEVDVLHIRPAMLRARPGRFLLLLLITLAGFAGLIMLPAPPFNFIAGGVGLAALIALIAWKLKTLGEGIRVTSKRLIDREGFFSRRTSEVLHTDIRNVQIRQSFWQRLWGVGTIAISCSAEHEDEVQMDDVPKPDHVAKIIDLYRPL